MAFVVRVDLQPGLVRRMEHNLHRAGGDPPSHDLSHRLEEETDLKNRMLSSSDELPGRGSQEDDEEDSMFARKTLVAAAALTLIAGLASADMKLTQTQHTDGFTVMGQTEPARDQTVTMWIGKDRMRTDSGKDSVIVRLDQKKLYLVKHRERSYSVVNLPVDVKNLLPDGMYDQMMQMMEMKAEVTPTDETAVISGWSARKYQVTISSAMMQTKQEVWATTELDLDYESFLAMMEASLNMQPGSASLIEEFRKIKGLQVRQRSVMSMMGAEVASTTEVTSAEEAQAPAGTYELPAGYNETQLDLMSELQKGRG